MQTDKMKIYGFDNFFSKQVETLNDELVPARIIGVHRGQYRIITSDYESNAKLKGSAFYNQDNIVTYPAVGDFVLVKPNNQGDDIIHQVLNRKSKFSRIDTFSQEKEEIIATNFDICFIVTSCNHDFNVRRLERYLSIAWQSGATPVIVLTKLDLCKDISEYVNQIHEIAFGIDVISVSSYTGEGIDELSEFIKPKQTIIFLGSSGVGKSSLVNALCEKEIMKVKDIREDDSKGRHTTTHRELIFLKNSAMIIDTPGMRALGMWDASDGVSTTFSDITKLVTLCKFNDCAHNTEPNCAVKRALESGELSVERWESYLKLEKEAAHAERKEDLNLLLKHKAENKVLHKALRRFQNPKK